MHANESASSNPSHLVAPRIGGLASGPRDAITDVKGVLVGHSTIDQGDVQTGVTVVMPHHDPFMQRPLAACCVLNGFGKSIGLMQLEELGCLETPIALTNTFGVGTVATAQTRMCVARHPTIGREWPTVNPLVLECNDGWLNDIQAFAVQEEHYKHALEAASDCVTQGSVGAGRGMSCFGLKGGIGTASRVVSSNNIFYTVGVLVLSNFGILGQCTIAGRPLGSLLGQRLAVMGELTPDDVPEKGSIIVVLATDAPLDTVQLRRLAKRCGNGLARTGSNFGHGSGDIVLAFTTANTLPRPEGARVTLKRLPDTELDRFFQAAADSSEQAVVNALFSAETVAGRNGRRRLSITEVLPDWNELIPSR